MTFFTDNLNWILFNIVLASIPVSLVLLLRKKYHPFVHFGLLLLWLIFLPNTIYLLTDLQYLPYQVMRAGIVEQALLFVEYGLVAILGVTSYMFCLEPAKVIVKKLKIKRGNENIFYIVLHFIVAFGVIMGKVQRTHSWYVFTDFVRVMRDVKATISLPYLLMWVVFFGIIINILFFLFKKYFRVGVK